MTQNFATANSAQLPPEHVQQAAQWHALIHSGEVSRDDEADFKTWYSIVRNAEAYQKLEKIWTRFDSVEETQERKVLEDVLSEQEKTEKNSRVPGPLLSITLLICGAMLGLQLIPNEGLVSEYIASGRLFSDHNTSVGESKVVVLSDQTRIHLNTFSSINIEYTDSQRKIHLLQGEIQLDVAKDAARPLIVISDQGSARALGTQFTVRDRGNVTDVEVTESRVEVCPSSKEQISSQCRQLGAGESTQISESGVQQPQPVDATFNSDWPQLQLVVDNQPLLLVLDELSRYQSSYMKVDRQALAKLTVSGVFPLDDIDRSLQVLADSLPIRVKTYTPLLTVIERQ